jgi:hypothetical protein
LTSAWAFIYAIMQAVALLAVGGTAYQLGGVRCTLLHVPVTQRRQVNIMLASSERCSAAVLESHTLASHLCTVLAPSTYTDPVSLLPRPCQPAAPLHPNPAWGSARHPWTPDSHAVP